MKKEKEIDYMFEGLETEIKDLKEKNKKLLVLIENKIKELKKDIQKLEKGKIPNAYDYTGVFCSGRISGIELKIEFLQELKEKLK
jgi:ribosomal protein L30E